MGVTNAAVRDGTTISRNNNNKNNSSTQTRTATTAKRTTSPRTTILTPHTTKNTPRGETAIARTATKTSNARSAINQTPVSRTGASRNMTPIISRTSTNNTSTLSNTRTGAEYEQCKNTYFSCMDQFCTLKNDDYRRCSCNDRVFELDKVRDVLEDAGQQLTTFTENLTVVGMTAEQATAMRTESEGEAALTDDNSASKALLQAIMNSIRGEDSTVGGKYSDLNSITIAFDTVNAFGMTDIGQAIAAYNGNALYNAVYPQCRQAVRADCNDASLQRAITAYLMAIEQDCNTVQTAIEETQKQMKSAVREGSAMLDLARIENRQKHNSSDITTCINEVEQAILSEQVCGANYHKCLDNGEFIDISTGKPIAGVEDFYKLQQLLTFSDGIEAADQRLSKNSSNRKFVHNFETRVKKFAEPALNKCVENADFVWSEYLDKAMLAIYYAQQSKVEEIKQGCFDYVSACYMNGDTAITAAMAELTDASNVVLQPDKVALNAQMCTDYVNSCNNMFDDNIIAQYIANRQETDTLTACRAVVKQCFNKYGGTNYENFYYPFSGLFDSTFAPDWFTLYEYTADGKKAYKSDCAQQLTKIDACSDPKMIENAFGGFDSILARKGTDPDTGEPAYYQDNTATDTTIKYGILESADAPLKHRYTRPVGVATEIYNQIISILSTQCMNLQGRFVEYQFIKEGLYDSKNFCTSTFYGENTAYNNPSTAPFTTTYAIGYGEDMCPRDYALGVDTQSWGACLCWENGGRRSKWGKSAKCIAALPVIPTINEEKITNASGQEETIYTVDFPADTACTASMTLATPDDPATTDVIEGDDDKTPNNNESVSSSFNADSWCTQTIITNANQVCPWAFKSGEGGNSQTVVSFTYGADDPSYTKQYCVREGITYTELPDALE